MMDIVQKFLAFVVVLGVLVIFHELGHFAVARWFGVKVLRFSVGFGRIVWSRTFGRDGTQWAVSAIPLGGYVKMCDEREGPVAPADVDRAFNRQSVWKRIAIVAAGPIANLVLAVVLFAGTYVVGIPGQRATLAAPPPNTPAAAAGVREGDLVKAADGAPVGSWQDLRWRMLRASGGSEVTLEVERPDGARVVRIIPIGELTGADWERNFMQQLGLKADFGPPVVEDIVAGKPAQRAGIERGDRIVAIDGVPVASPSDAAAATNAHPGVPIVVTLERSGHRFAATLTPDVVDESGRKIGIAGLKLRIDPAVAKELAVTVRYGVVDAVAQGARKTWELSVFTLKMLGRILIGDASLKNISGPITMADYAGQSVQAGMLVFVGYLALISISLGVLNLLPVPLLDGGHLLYYLAEVVKGSPVSDRAFEVGQRIGMAVLAVLMALALFNDLSRLF
jgi:regulator of sigma E protease